MMPARPILQVVLAAVAIAAVIGLFDVTDIDLWVQDHFFDFKTGQWLVDRKEPVARTIFYTGPKVALWAVGIGCAAGVVASVRHERFRRWRRGCALTALSIVLVPLSVALLKNVTNVYTPHQTARYAGDKPYVKVLGRYPPGFVAERRGLGFPASHAAAGFALMVQAFALRRRAARRVGLAVGLAAGCVMGAYQTVNGQHFLSHTIVSMLIAWIIIVALAATVGRAGWLNENAASGSGPSLISDTP